MNNKYGWTLTDDDSAQYCKKINENTFLLIEFTKYTDSKNCIVYADSVDISSVSTDEMVNIIASYGYNSVAAVQAEYQEGMDQILAECVFESRGLTSGEFTKMVKNEQTARDFIDKFINCEIQDHTNDLIEIKTAIEQTEKTVPNKYGWILSDDESLYSKKLEDNKYALIATGKCIGCDAFFVYADYVDVSVIPTEMILDFISTYDYESIEDLEQKHPENANQIIAECVFKAMDMHVAPVLEKLKDEMMAADFVEKFIDCDIQSKTNDLIEIRQGIMSGYCINYDIHIHVCADAMSEAHATYQYVERSEEEILQDVKDQFHNRDVLEFISVEKDN